MKASLILVLLIVPLMTAGAQPIVTVHPDGWCTISYLTTVNETIMELPIYGDPNLLIVTDEDGLPLNFTLEDGRLVVDAVASGQINVTYETQSLTSKEGAVWTLNFSWNAGFVVVRLEGGPNIVGLSSIPEEIREGDNYLEIAMRSPFYLDYVYVTPAQSSRVATDSILIIAAVAITLILATLLLIKVKKKREEIPLHEFDSTDLRILSSIGEGVLLSDLRERLSIPKTTLWRRTKRLEEKGLVEIEKRSYGSFLKITRKGKIVLDEIERQKS